jgi:hypothetical protein
MSTKSTQTSRVASMCAYDFLREEQANPARPSAGSQLFAREVVIQIPIITNGLARRSRQPGRSERPAAHGAPANTRKNLKSNVIVETPFKGGRLVDMPLLSISITARPA